MERSIEKEIYEADKGWVGWRGQTDGGREWRNYVASSKIFCPVILSVGATVGPLVASLMAHIYERKKMHSYWLEDEAMH